MCDRYSGGGREPRARGGVVTVPGDLELSDSDPEDPGAGPPLDAEVKEVNSSSDDDEEVATVRSGSVGRPSPSAPLSNFSLKGGSSSFSFRSRSIFDCLDGVAKETASEPGQDDAVDGVFARPTPPPPLASGKKPGGPQAGRKRHVTEEPGAPAPAPVPVRRGTPDYLLHPERWTRYSLEEVAETSDSRNRSVALQYLLSLQQSKEQGPGPAGERFLPPESSVGPSPHRIIFSRPGRGAGREERADEGRAAADGGGRKGGLSHLQEEDEEGEDEGEDLDTSPAAVPPKAEQRKRKWGHGRGGGGGVVEEMEEEEDDDDEKKKVEKSEPEVPPEFASFRKAHRKNYRKTSEQEDE